MNDRRSSALRVVGCLGFTGLLAGAWAGPLAAGPSQEAETHWAYRGVQRYVPPVETGVFETGAFGPVENPVDAFVLARLQARGLTPSAEAPRRVLIRRATLDLHGLPPSPEDVTAFVDDPRPDAYERLMDRLLASPRYGERWARHWLDLARYAESDGYKSDRMRPGAWHYRDYVIRALNADKPYDRFVEEQLAGDEMTSLGAPDGGADALVATGFLRHWPLEDNGRHLHEMWQTILSDVTGVAGQVFLGLTVGCARCHDHKFDAITRRDYFRLQAFFASMAPDDDVSVGAPEEILDLRAKQTAWDEATATVRKKLRDLERPFRLEAQFAKGRKFPDEVQRIVATAPADRSLLDRQVMLLAGSDLRVSAKDMQKRMDAATQERWQQLQAELSQFASLRPAERAPARGVRNLEGVPPLTRIPDDPEGEVLAPGFPAALSGSPPPATSLAAKFEDAEAGGGAATTRRTRLARWLTSPRNPLTARVMVNRLWQHHFGRGIVATPSDFGVQGARPTHPKLLDWLASEFVARGWSLKAMHRLMMLSATYRRSSVQAADVALHGLDTDPENQWLSRYRANRVEAEVLRDSILATSGELNLCMFGASARPELPAELKSNYTWEPSAKLSERNRRSCYLVVRRNAHLPLLGIFDSPSTFAPCARRATTTTAAQALVLLNSRWGLERARAFAGRLLAETEAETAPTRTGALLQRAHQLVYARPPAADELAAAETFLREARTNLAERLRRGEPVALPTPIPRLRVDPALGAALVDYCHALWNTNEFVYVD